MGETVFHWTIELRQPELAVSTLYVIDKAVSSLPKFKEGNAEKPLYWVYNFMKHRNLSVRTRTRTSQILDSAMQPVRDVYCHRIMTSYNLRINNPKYLVDMDETAIYLNSALKRTVHLKGEKIVPVMIDGSSSMRFTLAVTVAMDGTKLPLFVIFKGKQGGTVEKQLSSILHAGVTVSVQKKAWMENNTIFIWYGKVDKPHIANHCGHSGLLLDDFKCHKNDELRSTMHNGHAMCFMIPPHYNGILQPCDVDINKSLRTRWKRLHLIGSVATMLHLIGGLETMLHYYQAKRFRALSTKMFVNG